MIALDLACGARGLLFATNGWVEDEVVEIELPCARARLLISDALYVAARGKTLRLAPDEGETADGQKAYWGACHGELVADFYDYARSGRPFPLDPDEGLKTLRMLEEFYACAGRPPRHGREGDARR
ncbi:MAG: hypothetical protein Q8M76_17240 [Spirochaetaceae bacterium]|nr:hypothetical protein [Spirochaetaceae bacterium]